MTDDKEWPAKRNDGRERLAGPVEMTAKGDILAHLKKKTDEKEWPALSERRPEEYDQPNRNDIQKRMTGSVETTADTDYPVQSSSRPRGNDRPSYNESREKLVDKSKLRPE